MKRLTIGVLIAAVVLVIWASIVWAASAPIEHIGRFQMSATFGSVYLIDTTSGELWIYERATETVFGGPKPATWQWLVGHP